MEKPRNSINAAHKQQQYSAYKESKVSTVQRSEHRPKQVAEKISSQALIKKQINSEKKKFYFSEHAKYFSSVDRPIHATKMSKHLAFTKAMFNILSKSHVPIYSTLKEGAEKIVKWVPKNTSEAAEDIKLGRMVARSIFGTQEPKLWLRTESSYPSTTVTTGAFNIVAGLCIGDVLDIASYQAIFEEYKYSGPIKYKMANYYSPLNGWCVCIFDYDDSSSLASWDEAVAYDTHKLLPLSALTNFSSDKDTGPFTMTAHVQGEPDKQWQPMSVNGPPGIAYIPVYWKSFSSITQGTDTTARGVFILYAEFLIQFRAIGT